MKRRFILVALVVLIAAIVAIVLLLKRGQKPESIRTTGLVEGVEVNISKTVSGRILKPVMTGCRLRYFRTSSAQTLA